MQPFGGNNLVKPAQAPEAVLQYAYSLTQQPPRGSISIKEGIQHYNTAFGFIAISD